MLTFRQKLALCWRIMRKDDSNSLRHADAELLLAFPPDAGDSDMPGWNDAMRLQCQEVLTVFAAQGNSGMSASIATGVIATLMKQEPLTPLTGLPDEWNDVGHYGDGPGTMYQNRRCSHVFKEVGPPDASNPFGERCYTINGYVFVEPSGAAYTSAASRKPIAFPYTPGEAERIKVDEFGVPLLKIHREQFGFAENEPSSGPEKPDSVEDVAPLALVAEFVQGSVIERRTNAPSKSDPMGQDVTVAVTGHDHTRMTNLFNLLTAAKISAERAD